AFGAQTADRLDEGVEIILAVIVGDLFARGDVPDGADEDDMTDGIGLGVGPARMIAVARDIAARRAVDRPAAVDLVHVAVVDLVRDLGRELAALVLDDLGALGDRLDGEQSEPGAGAANAIVTAGKEFHQDSYFKRQRTGPTINRLGGMKVIL